MESARVEPFGLFTREAAESGGVLSWELLRYVVGIPSVLVLLGWWLGRRGLPLLGAVVILAAGAALILLGRRHIAAIASRWSMRYYGRPLPPGAPVWWEVTWRSSVVGFAASAALTPPTVMATSLQLAFPAGVAGALIHAVLGLMLLLNVAASVVATGWAMSRAVLKQLPPGDAAGVPPIPAPVAVPVAAPAAPPEVRVTTRPAPPTPARAAAAAPSPAPVVAADGKRQCPKCGLYETQRGSVIGWYCKVCGWRDSRR